MRIFSTSSEPDEMDQMDQRRIGSPDQPSTVREGMVKSASAYADLQQHRSEGVHRKPSPVSSYVPQPDYVEGDEEDDLIKPKKLVNPVKASKSHQELHRELLSSYKRGGVSVETKPELHRVLESRKRDQLIKQRKQEDEARKKISPLEAELLKRHKKLEEVTHTHTHTHRHTHTRLCLINDSKFRRKLRDC
uniref:Actin-associated protein FAM107A n=1 Tax=Seriola lalandi dorsalis TaxID=1841481 RepID=A0A3B4YK00_SERLL